MLSNYKIVDEICDKLDGKDRVDKEGFGKKRLSREFKVRTGGGDMSEKVYDYYELNDISNEHKLLCVGNNGILGNIVFDRKGFKYAIEASTKLDLFAIVS